MKASTRPEEWECWAHCTNGFVWKLDGLGTSVYIITAEDGI